MIITVAKKQRKQRKKDNIRIRMDDHHNDMDQKQHELDPNHQDQGIENMNHDIIQKDDQNTQIHNHDIDRKHQNEDMERKN